MGTLKLTKVWEDQTLEMNASDTAVDHSNWKIMGGVKLGRCGVLFAGILCRGWAILPAFHCSRPDTVSLICSPIQ